ncbi:MAG: CopG family transcriptional regulator [Candidatus Bathyarchaeota archaeon]|nr:CopG family transcriptional regulator [Candidatus Bathyarchaeota archaeon]
MDEKRRYSEWVIVTSKTYVGVRMSRELYEKIERKVKESQGEFKEAQEYVGFVLNEATKEDEETETAYTPEEEKEIKRRLKQLGYL